MKGVGFSNLTASTIQASASKQKAHRARESSVTFSIFFIRLHHSQPPE